MDDAPPSDPSRPRPSSDAEAEPDWPSTAWPVGPITRPDRPAPSRSDPSSPPSAPRSPDRSGSRWTMVLTLLGGVLLGTGVTLGVLGLVGVLDDDGQVEAAPATTVTSAPTTTAVQPPPLAAEPGSVPSVTSVASSAIPSIVAVQVAGPAGVGGGSGVVYASDGYILTNNHVIEGANDVAVVFSDGIRYQAEVVGGDPLTDIAVIRTDRPDLAPIRLGDQADLVIGERTVAVGNPLGLEGGPSVTTGILSATGRSLAVRSDTTLYGLLQTDAPITRGSSGGALLDQEAKLIGITTAIGVSDVGAEGLGFAVPVDMAVNIADDLISDGQVDHALLGIQGQSVTETVDGAEIPLGVGVTDLSGSPSAYAAAGGEIGDVIISLDGREIATIDALIARLRMRREGEDAVVRVLRGENELTFDVTLGAYDLAAPDNQTPEP